MPDAGLVVDKSADVTGSIESYVDYKKHSSTIIIVVLIIIVAIVAYYKSDGFVSPDGVVARRSQRQIRGDTEVDRTWNLEQLEKSVALLNRKSDS